MPKPRKIEFSLEEGLGVSIEAVSFDDAKDKVLVRFYDFESEPAKFFEVGLSEKDIAFLIQELDRF